jgi:hypothetical protein
MNRRSRVAFFLIIVVLLVGSGVLFGITSGDLQTAAMHAMDSSGTTPRPQIAQLSLAEWRHDSTGTFISERQALDIALNANPHATGATAVFIRKAGNPASGAPVFEVTLNGGRLVVVSARSGRIMD